MAYTVYYKNLFFLVSVSFVSSRNLGTPLYISFPESICPDWPFHHVRLWNHRTSLNKPRWELKKYWWATTKITSLKLKYSNHFPCCAARQRWTEFFCVNRLLDWLAQLQWGDQLNVFIYLRYAAECEIRNVIRFLGKFIKSATEPNC